MPTSCWPGANGGPATASPPTAPGRPASGSEQLRSERVVEAPQRIGRLPQLDERGELLAVRAGEVGGSQVADPLPQVGLTVVLPHDRGGRSIERLEPSG